ncbi:metalloprotease [Crepidotus variabilis]|uniref:Extracellular metalloproteinase n=1 Tax=Crepidotus variabilis TaxID=179855 RepID=A0A9P6EK46_9AGAR|nr:metalloprotease [Crepidotus variabilis]
MVFIKLLSSVLLAVQLSGFALGSPAQKATASILSRSDDNILGVPVAFHPQAHYETYGTGIELPAGAARGTPEESGAAFAQYKLGVSADQIKHQSGFSSEVADHVYLAQVHDGVPFANAVANVAMKDGKVISFGSSFVETGHIAASRPTANLDTSVKVAEAALLATHSDIPPALEYLVQPSGEIALVHSVQVKNETSGVWGIAYVNAHTGKFLSIASFVAQASYQAVSIARQSIEEGQSILVDPQESFSSPNGWHTTSGQLFTTTTGNNAISYVLNSNGGYYIANQSAQNLTFHYPWDANASPQVNTNPYAAMVNAFYTVNRVHDILYFYGFREYSFNFQNDNFGRGGRDGDYIRISVQDYHATNNAFFATPPDGQPGQMTLHLVTKSTVARDTALDNSIIAHEYGHGLTNRMVGGGGANCLGQGQSAGLGEGWGDMLANWIWQSSASTRDFKLGGYTFNMAGGLRSYPYSTNPTTNPLKFSSLNGRTESHAIGEVWANMLHNVYAALVAVYGFASDAYKNPGSGKGNSVFLLLLVDSLSLTPCYPTVIAARNAWIQADQNRYKGANICIIYRAFASRGLGTNAATTNAGYFDGFAVPAGC